MKVLILDGSIGPDDASKRVASVLEEILTERKVHHEMIRLGDRKLMPCTGCRDCWTLSPGICGINDDGMEIMRAWMSSDIVVLISRMTFGGHSSLIKRALDRLAGILMPYLIAEADGVERMARYHRYPSMLGIAVCDEIDREETETYRMLIRQNGRTLRSGHSKSLVLWKGEPEKNVRELVESTIMNMKVAR
ncbi:MAG: flavodoxin family protein [Methanomassiliicoccales archaeon]|nr:MAG: flavodoxin family protein [Methanomassiliicoccales archaeon]